MVLDGKQRRGGTKTAVITVCGCVVVVLVLCVLGVLRVREMAHQVRCHSHLKMLGAAIGAYVDDHENKLPNATRWCDLVKPYAGNTDKVFVCPSDRTPSVRCSFVFNRNLKSNSWFGATMAVVLFESAGASWNASGGPEMFGKNSPHRDGCNVLFSNGHVQWIRRSEMKNFKWVPSPAKQQPEQNRNTVQQSEGE